MVIGVCVLACLLKSKIMVSILNGRFQFLGKKIPGKFRPEN